MALQKGRKSRGLGRPRKYSSNAARQRAYRQRLKRSVHFRSDHHRWETPPALFAALDAEFHFTTDVCALPENAKCPHYFTPADDGLAQAWTGICWMNPPYGAVIDRWVRKASEASQTGATVVCLLPARTDTRWWHQYVLPFAEIRYLRGRQRFVGAKSSAPFPSAVVIFQPTPGARGE